MNSILKNGALCLLPLAPEHKDTFAMLATIPEVNRWINEPIPYTDAHFEALMERTQTQNLRVWMIQHEGELCGVINAGSREKGIFQGGYWIHPAQSGKGIASSALRLVKNFLLERCGAKRVQAVVEPENKASMRVLEKCGYVKEDFRPKFYPTINRGPIDVWMYGCEK